jgi:ATP-dependent Clp protease, protease subunit
MARRPGTEPIDCLFANGLWTPGRTLTIGNIDKDEYFKVRKGLLVLSGSTEDITIILNSGGGSFVDGMGIFDAISHISNIHITIRVEGEASSMGSVILQAADHRVATRNAVFMLHDGSDSYGDGTCRDFERAAAFSKRGRETMYEIFANRTGKSVAYYRRLLAHDWYLSADEALKEGLIDEIAG